MNELADKLEGNLPVDPDEEGQSMVNDNLIREVVAVLRRG